MKYDKIGFPVGPTFLPWGGLGADVSECRNSTAVLVKAGLDWEVKEEAAYVQISNGDNSPAYWLPAINSQFMVRGDFLKGDLNRILGHVSTSFKVSQNCDTFSLFDHLVDTGALEYVRAGSFRFGRVVWMVARILGAWREIGDDGMIESYLVLRNAHDGSGSLEIIFVTVDLQSLSCVSFPVKGVTPRLRLRHTKTTGARAVTGSSGLEKVFNVYLSNNLRIFHGLESIPVSDSLVTQILLSMYPGSKSSRADGVAIIARSAIHARFMAAERRTGYALWHGICAFLDHSKTSHRVGNDPKESRMNGILWGSRALQRQKLGTILLNTLLPSPT